MCQFLVLANLSDSIVDTPDPNSSLILPQFLLVWEYFVMLTAKLPCLVSWFTVIVLLACEIVWTIFGLVVVSVLMIFKIR